MIVRVCSPFGTKRISVEERESVTNFFDKVKKEFIINDCHISRKQNGDEPIRKSTKLFINTGLKHGDMVYMKVRNSTEKVITEMEVDGDIKSSNLTGESSHMKTFLQEDEIDKILSKMDGRIYRQRNEQYCRHGPSGKCIHCVPLEPYDEEYLEHCDPPIQFISFHAYLRKLGGGQHQGKFTTLENINCKIKLGCKEHLPWPEGICTKCQPSAITLSVQKYRHVDNIMFENASLMNNFLDFWRKTGSQRIGILFGYYTTFDQAPLGIKAVVTAIYEPEQKCTSKSVEILNLKTEKKDNFSKRGFLNESVIDVAKALGLSPVGWIFTDLISDDANEGTVKHYRGTMDTYFLTAQECITAAFLQNLFPNICQLSPNGYFGSKFVTVVVTGDKNNTIHFEGYQVSSQCMALVRDEILVPTCDAPELGYIRESTTTQYVPDVFCKQKDKYGNSITTPGRPLPVEFLLVHMTAAFPKEEQFYFKQTHKNIISFPIENRSQLQNHISFVKYMKQFNDAQLAEALCDIHLLWYLSSLKEVPSLKDHVHSFCTAYSSQVSPEKAVCRVVESMKVSQEWLDVTKMMRNENDNEGGSKGLSKKIINGEEGKNEEDKAVWSCAHCTYHNHNSESSCQMCGLPR